MDGLSAKDICAVLKACRANGVKALKMGGVEVTFGDQTPLAPSYVYKINSWLHDDVAVEEEVNHVDEDEMRLQMAIENPVEWERAELSEVANG